jgi:hypothetical protein
MSAVDIEAWADALIALHATVDMFGHELVPITHDHPMGAARIRSQRSTRHPVDRLRRYRPGAEVRALGLVCGGWAAPMEDRGARMPSAHPDARRMLQVVVMDRMGDMTARVRYGDGSIVELGGAGVGRVPDAMRRALGRVPEPPTA